MDAATGLTMGVDIIPDVPNPGANIHDLTREMERQMDMASVTNTPVVGAMSNGQLYALPLRRRRSSDQIVTSTSTSTGYYLVGASPATQGKRIKLTIGHCTNHWCVRYRCHVHLAFHLSR
mmetsp:Transcript_3299/g.7127  ORF Transcript_3299/g.7127 Transcript_3299/m.7127 type:complete len:120 (-) Transcript_3299:81-440(-)